MNDTTAPAAPQLASFTLDHDITVNGEVKLPAGTRINVRRPHSGELRGLKLLDLMQMDANALHKLAPRITNPIIHEPMAAAMDPADFLQLAAEVTDFLLPSRARQDFPTA